MARSLAHELHDAITAARSQPEPGSAEAEAQSDALLASAQAWHDDAHSERPNTKWNRKHVRGQAELDANREAFDSSINAHEIVTAASASLSRREYLCWHYCDCEGVTQDRLSEALGVSRRTIGRALLKAREELKWLVGKEPLKVFRDESHRSAYFAPQHRPDLPPGVEEARERIEMEVEVTTHIMPDDLGLVEVWIDGERQLEDVPGGEPKPIGAKRVSSLRTRVKRDRRALVTKAKMKKVRAQQENS